MIRNALKLLLIVALLLAAYPMPSARAQTPGEVTVSFQDGVSPAATYAGTRDTMLVEDAGTTNYDDVTVLALRADGNPTYSRSERRFLIQWDISSIPPGSRVRGAKIAFTVSDSASRSYSVHPLQKCWNESQATWLKAADGVYWLSAGAYGKYPFGDNDQPVATFLTDNTGVYETSLNYTGAQYLQLWVNKPERNCGFVVTFDEKVHGSTLGVDSSEATVPIRRPKLTITFIPPDGTNTAPRTYTQNEKQGWEDGEIVMSPLFSSALVDADEDPLVYFITRQPSHGRLEEHGPYLYYYPERNFFGYDNFDYIYSDGLAQSPPMTMELVIEPRNDPPVPNFVANKWSGPAPLLVTFTPTVSDVEGDQIQYDWNFGGVGHAFQEKASFIFNTPGLYQVTLNVYDGSHIPRSITRPILVEPADELAGKRNVILFVGDGMGPEHIRTARVYGDGSWWEPWPGLFDFEGFPFQADVVTSSLTTLNNPQEATDSAAAATAMATGVKVSNNVISLDLQTGQPLKTVLEYARDAGQSTGLVTTNNITDATPSGFGAHEPTRQEDSDPATGDAIASDYLTQTRPNVLFGAGGRGMTVEKAQNAGYTVVTDRAGFPLLSGQPYVSGQFTNDALPYEYAWPASELPRLTEMTAQAINLLDDDPDGFFLLVENENIDRAAHLYDIDRVANEIYEFDRSVQLAVDWARTHPNTLIVVLGDHETSGLELDGGTKFGEYNQRIPNHHWTARIHTTKNVRAFALGPGAEQVTGVLDNTDLFAILAGENFTGPVNRNPFVSAGVDQTITLPDKAILAGEVSDDGLPVPDSLTAIWSKTGGPGEVTFTAVNSEHTEASFSAAGIYTLRLTASDGELDASDELLVTVLPAVATTQPPTPTHTPTSTLRPTQPLDDVQPRIWLPQVGGK